MSKKTQDNATLSQSYPGHWRGRWIWDSGEPYPFHYFLMFRRSFEVPEPAAGAIIRVTCSGRYILYVNGDYVGRGPARSGPQWKSYDIHDLTHMLRSGKNTVAVLGYHYGCANNYTRDDRSGFWAQIELQDAKGNRQVIGTDAQWKVCHAKGWDREVGLINSAIGVTEVYDARIDPVDWMGLEFEDKDWDDATVIDPNNSPWIFLEARQTPLMLERVCFPMAVAATGEIREYSHHINGLADNLSVQQVPERLASEVCGPTELTRLTNVDGALSESGPAMRVQSYPYAGATGGGSRSPYVIFDFGRPLFGFPRVRLNGRAGGVVEMTYGMDLVAGRVPPVADGCRFGDRYVMRDGEQTWQLFEYKAFRYLQLVFRNMPEPTRVDNVSVVEYVYPADRRGSFECSDATLTRLWEAAVYSAHLQLEDSFICDPIRERRVFTGDTGQFGVFAGYGDLAIVDWYLRQITRAPTIDGMLRVIYPGTEVAMGGNLLYSTKKAEVFETPLGMPIAGLAFVVVLAEHYRHFGKIELLRDIYLDLARLARWYIRHADANGLHYNLPYWNWCDWTATEMRGANFENNAFYYGSLMGLALMADDLGYHADAEEYRHHAALVRDALQRLHWNEERGLFVDSWIEDETVELFTENANGMALYFGIADPGQVERIVGVLKDPKADIVRGSPLLIAYTFEGLAARGHLDEALRQMSERYAAMVDEGIKCPTMWERWSLPEGGAGAHSKLHAQGAGVAWTLSKHVLGVQPLTPGYGRCRIEPGLGDLEWARGVVPTVRGDIRVEWRRENGRCVLNVKLPPELETTLAAPADARSVSLDGNSIPGREHTVVGGEHRMEWTS